MHELSIVSGMIDKIEKIKLQEKWLNIYKIKLVMGLLSGVEQHAVETCFDILTNSWEVKPKLVIQIDPIKYRCQNCHQVSYLATMELSCKLCNSSMGEISGGKDLYVSELEGE